MEKFGFRMLGGILMDSIHSAQAVLDAVESSKFWVVRWARNIWQSTATAQDAPSSALRQRIWENILSAS